MLKNLDKDENEIVDTLKLFIKFAEEVLPQAGPLVLDIGVINDALVGSGKIITRLENKNLLGG